MIFWGDAFPMPRPDSYKVKAVARSGYYCHSWREVASYPTKAEAMREADRLAETGDYTHIGIEPHASECGMFQSHALETVWEAD